MPVSRKTAKKLAGKVTPSSTAARLDILFSGPLLLVPEVANGNIASVEVFSPCNGHPVGALFVPEVWFTDAELNAPESPRWPIAESFTLLDPHSYHIELTQEEAGATPFPVLGIPDGNFRIKPGRRLTHDWEVSVKVSGHLSGWTSHRIFSVDADLYIGADAPATPTATSLHRLTYNAVTGAEFCGASKNPRDYLRANAAKGGTLIVVGEVPYQSTLLHERRAIDALAKLAGLDLHLVSTDPAAHKTRLMMHTMDCGMSGVMG